MKIAVGSDERTHLTDFVIKELKDKGIELELHGPLNEEDIGWTDVAEKVAERVKKGSQRPQKALENGTMRMCWQSASE